MLSGLCLGTRFDILSRLLLSFFQCSVEGRGYLRGMLALRLWFSAWISSRASSRLWHCLGSLPVNLLLPLFTPINPTPSRQLSQESRREMSDWWSSFYITHTGGTDIEQPKVEKSHKKMSGFQSSQQLRAACSSPSLTFLFISLIFHRDLCRSLTDTKNFLHKASTKISFHVWHQQHCWLKSKEVNRRSEYTLLVCLWIQSNVFVSLNSSFMRKQMLTWLQSPWAPAVSTVSLCLG